MCWTSRFKPKRIVATEDVTVYKIMERKGDKFVTPFYQMIMEENIPNPLISLKYFMYIYITTSRYYIDSGYHSYSTQEDAIAFLERILNNEQRYTIFEAVIPKGATYCTNEKNETVSSMLTIIREIKNVRREKEFVGKYYPF